MIPVLVVSSVLFLGIAIYLFILDFRLKRLERKNYE